MTLGELKTLFRTLAQDAIKPYLWSDLELTGHANEGEIEACRRAHLLVDSTSEAAQASVSLGESTVLLDARLLFIRRARLQSCTVPLLLRVARTMDDQVPGWENALPSNPVVLIPDLGTGLAQLYPPPAKDDTLKLTIVREPLNEMVADADRPEIPRRYHRALVDWMLYRAYQKTDTETLDRERSNDALGRFEAEFGAKSRAIDEHWSLEQYYDVGDFQ